VVATILGVLGLILFIVSVIALAAGITWVVVKLTPQRNRKQQETA
jgi:flagellar biogenesis protein FliO